jgi:hypothetical protein
MKLNQALKEKNRLVRKLNSDLEIAKRENSINTLRKRSYDLDKVWDEIDSVTGRLNGLKTAICKANVGIYEKIERMSELKGRIAFLIALNTKHGEFEETVGWGEDKVRKETWDAFYSKQAVDNMVETLQEQIDVLQDEIDTYNATTEIEL